VAKAAAARAAASSSLTLRRTLEVRRTRRFGRDLWATAFAAGVICALVGCSEAAALNPSARMQNSRIVPQSSTGDLIYAGGSATNDVYVFSYPGGSLVGKLVAPSGTLSIQGLCSDSSGDVFVTTFWQQQRSYEPVGRVYEYAHGGTQAIVEYDIRNEVPFGCAADSLGNLAVTVTYADGGQGAVAVFTLGGSGSKYNTYSTKAISSYFYCTYDHNGNLFVNGAGSGPRMVLAELPKGAYTMKIVTMNKNVSVAGMGELQWVGRYLTLEDPAASAIYRLSIADAKARVAGTTQLNGWNDVALSNIYGGSVLIPNGPSGNKIAVWKYPAGGKITSSLASPAGLFGITVSAGSGR
jgi:hypothetical protein